MTIVASTNAENVYAMSPGIEIPAPSSEQDDAGRERDARRPGEDVVASPRSEARRHATSGPIPISRSSGSPKTRRKKS